MRASGASELRKFSHFHILKVLFLSIFCWYFRYFVGTNDMLVGLNVPTNFQMYRENSEKALWGGGGAIAPPRLPPPPGYANDPFFGLGGGGAKVRKCQKKSQYRNIKLYARKLCMFSGIFMLNLNFVVHDSAF